VVLTQDPFKLFGMLLLIIKTGHGIRPSQPAPMLPPDHYGCGFGCKCFTGTLTSVEEHERECAHALDCHLPKGLDRDIFNSDKDKLALTLLDIDEPLQYPFSVLQKARRHAPASLLLSASEEMSQLESADQHPAPSQKLQTLKQQTLSAAPASASPLLSALIAPSPLSLNLLSYTLPHSTQTGDLNLVPNTTINSSRKKKVWQQQGQDMGHPTSHLVVKVTQLPAISPGHWGFVLKMRSPTRVGGFVWKYSPLLECCNNNLFWHATMTADTVIPCSSTLADRPPSLLPFPINGRGQPLFLPESTSPHTDQVLIDKDIEETILAGQNTGSPAVKGNGILHILVSPHLPHSSSFSPFRRSDPSPSLTSNRLDDGILPTPHFSTRLPSPYSLRRLGSFPTRSGLSQQTSSTPVSRLSGSHPLSFSTLSSPQFSPFPPHLSPVLASLPILSPPLPSLPTLLASPHSLLLP